MFEKSKDIKFKIGSARIGQGVDLLNKYFRLSLMLYPDYPHHLANSQENDFSQGCVGPVRK